MKKLLFFATKVMPAIFGGGIMFIVYNSYMDPLSEEELRELTTRRTRARSGGRVLDESELKLPLNLGVNRELLNASKANDTRIAKNDQEEKSSDEEKLKVR